MHGVQGDMNKHLSNSQARKKIARNLAERVEQLSPERKTALGYREAEARQRSEAEVDVRNGSRRHGVQARHEKCAKGAGGAHGSCNVTQIAKDLREYILKGAQRHGRGETLAQATMKREKLCSHALLLPTHLQGSASKRLKTKIM